MSEEKITRSSRRMGKAIRLKELDNFGDLKDWIMQGDALRGKLNLFVEKNIVHNHNLGLISAIYGAYLDAKMRLLLDKIVYQLPESAVKEELFKKFNEDNNLAKEFVHGWVNEVIKEIFFADLILLDQLKKIE